jgi:hypothetical protein
VGAALLNGESDANGEEDEQPEAVPERDTEIGFLNPDEVNDARDRRGVDQAMEALPVLLEAPHPAVRRVIASASRIENANIPTKMNRRLRMSSQIAWNSQVPTE